MVYGDAEEEHYLEEIDYSAPNTTLLLDNVPRCIETACRCFPAIGYKTLYLLQFSAARFNCLAFCSRRRLKHSIKVTKYEPVWQISAAADS